MLTIMPIASLVDYLAGSSALHVEHEWQSWHIRPILSGNNLLFHATRDASDLAVKFFIRDERFRAQREFASLTLIDRLDSMIGPRPVYLDLDSYKHSVLVQTWIEGSVLRSPPDDDATWLQIVQTYRRVHQVLPLDAVRRGVELGPTVNHIPCEKAVSTICEFAQQIPEEYRSDALHEMLQRLGQIRIPQVRQSRCWCHGDANIRNIILTSNGVGLVDWEYSGIADPAEELAKLMSHPFALPASEERWQWLAEQYAKLNNDVDILLRIQVNYALRLAWWYVRLLFGYHILLHRTSHRLVGPRAEEEISTPENIEHYFSRAHRQLSFIS
jgi:thiamine kinase-like enzyme